MNTRAALLRGFAVLCLLSSVLCFSGCASPWGPVSDPKPVTDRQATIAAAVEDTLSLGLVPVLIKNPDYVPIARTIAAALTVSDGATLTPGDVESFLAGTPLAPEDARTIAALVNAAWDTYSRRYAQQVGASIRPDVKLFLGAVANGLTRALAALPAPAEPAAT